MATKKSSNPNVKQTRKPEKGLADANMDAGETKPTRPRHYRKAAQEAIGKQYKTIVDNLATKAATGSVAHTKLLFDLGGVQEEVKSTAPKRRRPRSLGQILLKEAEALKRGKGEASANKPKSQSSGTA